MQTISDKMFFDIIANRQKNLPWKVDGYTIFLVYIEETSFCSWYDSYECWLNRLIKLWVYTALDRWDPLLISHLLIWLVL